jgi:hypothetical protein
MKRKHLFLGFVAIAALAKEAALTQGRVDPGPPVQRPEPARAGAFSGGTSLQDFAVAPRADQDSGADDCRRLG